MANNIPSWLRLKPEYIDENFDQVFEFLYDQRLGKCDDEMYKITVRLLEERVKVFLQESATVPVADVLEGKNNRDDKAKNVRNVKLLCSYILVTQPEVSETAIQAYCKLIGILASCVPSEATALAMVMVKTICSWTLSIEGFEWSVLKDMDSTRLPVMAHRIGSRNVAMMANKRYYEHKGTLMTESSGLVLSSLNNHDYQKSRKKNCIDLLEGLISVSSNEDNLKAHENEKIARLKDFTRDYIHEMSNMREHLKTKYHPGDQVNVIVTGIKDGHLAVRTIDTSHEIEEGVIMFSMQTYLCYYEEDFIANLPKGTVISVTKTASPGVYDIKDSFVRHIIENKVDASECIPAKMLFCKGGLATWFSEDGFPIFTPLHQEYSIGDYAILRITNVGTGKKYGYIGGEIAEDVDLSCSEDYDYYVKTKIPFDESEIKSFGFEGFALDIKPEEEEENHSRIISPRIVRDLCRMLLIIQKQQTRTSLRYKYLCVIRVLATLFDDEQLSEYAEFVAKYIESLVAFVNASTSVEYSLIPEVNADGEIFGYDGVQKSLVIVSLLRNYDQSSEENDKAIESIIAECADEQIARIASLVQSRCRISSIMNKSIDGLIKREIMRCLSIATDGAPDLEADSGTYIGVESSTQEFKTSFFEAPKSAKEQNQEITIFNTICGFLNTDFGGTLFIGVNDYGFVCGIDNDLETMVAKGLKNYKGIDGYCRYIQDRALLGKYLDQEHLACIEISPVYEDKAIAIKVKPYQYGVVRVNGIAYIRINGETQRMTETMKKQVSERKVSGSKETDIMIALRRAKEEKKIVILRSYSSSSSKTISDRTVEAHSFSNDKASVFCFEIPTGKNKVFNISRIGSVEITDQPWSNETEHAFIKQDIFRMCGNTPTHIKLRLSIIAKNCLVDEFIVPTQDLYEDSGKKGYWILDTDIYRFEGAGRFVIGLFGEIEILKGSELKEYVDAFVKNNFK